MSRRTTIEQRPFPNLSTGNVILYGLGAGILGVASMTVGEKVEQFFTHRPSSYVPGNTLARLLKIRPRSSEQLDSLNLAMHYGQGALAAVLRAFMSMYGMRGPFTDFLFTGVRLAIDQTLENWTGTGALPWTWPVSEQVIDVLHKMVYAFTTGFILDKWIQ